MDFNVQGLAELLKLPGEEDSDSDDDFKPKGATRQLGPADIGPKKAALEGKSGGSSDEIKKKSKDIWDADDIDTGAEYEDLHDPRLQPDYDIVYKQAVTSEDMYLQMGNKTNATSSCEEMLVKIQLPGQKLADVKLDVKKEYLDCRCPKYKLGLHLPHPVDAKNSRAAWDGDKEVLTVSLHLAREYDFVNF